MQLDKLELELRPQPNSQALDQGFTLLRAHAGQAYLAWLALWLPAIALATLLTCLMPRYFSLWIMLPWWLRPLLERAPLYLLSRQVFGQAVTWRQAVRAWPGQLGGGWFRLLTWWRPLMPGRGLYQPIWQLEGLRGTKAQQRRSVIAQGGTGHSAYWFGIACGTFETVLQLGFLGFIGIFSSDSAYANPFVSFVHLFQEHASLWMNLLALGCYGLAGAIIGPIYTACTFTLYLNRRAALEAWDIEIMLRQMTPPTRHRRTAPLSLLAMAVVLPALVTISWPRQAMAAPGAPVTAPAGALRDCPLPKAWVDVAAQRGPDHSAAQSAVRQQVAQLYANDDLIGYRCADEWHLKKPAKAKPEPTPEVTKGAVEPNYRLLAQILQVLLIAVAIGLVAWLLYRYRDRLPSLTRTRRFVRATEVGGLDIRAASLPDDVAAAARQLWLAGERRAALALLYRATLSRLVSQDGLQIAAGATEGDCLRTARLAAQRQQLAAARLAVAEAATSLWLNGAYGNRWPNDAGLEQLCQHWHQQFPLPAGVTP